jgi:hypothetical protein
MKTRFQTALQKLQRLAALALTALLLNHSAAAQDHENRPVPLAPEVTEGAAPPAFQAAVFPSLDPLVLKVVFRNPAREPLTLLVKNVHQEVVYRQPLGEVERYNSRYSLAELPDGNYQLEIEGKSVRYAKSLRVGTQVTRLAQAR